MTRTRGLSPKLIAPITAPLSVVVYTLISKGTLDRPSLGTAAVGVIAAIGAYLAGPGNVQTITS